MPSLRVQRASDDFARDLAGRIGRWLLLGLGGVIMLVGLVTAPLPGHIGLPLLVVGLMIVLRNSFKARRHFVRMQRAHPKMVFPIRRLMRREPEIVLVYWQQYLRMERLVLPSRARFAVKTRRYVRRRFKTREA
jgi:hypothetical protein